MWPVKATREEYYVDYSGKFSIDHLHLGIIAFSFNEIKENIYPRDMIYRKLPERSTRLFRKILDRRSSSWSWAYHNCLFFQWNKRKYTYPHDLNTESYQRGTPCRLYKKTGLGATWPDCRTQLLIFTYFRPKTITPVETNVTLFYLWLKELDSRGLLIVVLP